MAGDKINAKVQAWYPPSVTDNTVCSGAPLLVNNLISALSSGLLGAGSKGTLGELSNTSGVLNNPLTSFLSDPDRSYTSGKPKAYLNWILLDEQQFKYVDINNNSGAVQIPAIGGSEQKKLLQANGGADITIAKNGYIYVFVSNESQGAVYFDDLRVEHTIGAILEETHYYPFGLTMAGISSKAIGGIENKRKWNAGNELNSDFDINIYETQFRSLDPQIGRFWQIDPKPYELESPYVSMRNNPILYNDPLGDTVRLHGESAAIDEFIKMLNSTTGNTYKNKDGMLVRTNKTLNTKSNKNISGSLSKLVEGMITGRDNNNMTIRNDDKSDGGIAFDKFNTREVDMKDFGALKNNVQKASMLGHVLEEYSFDPNQLFNAREDRKAFIDFHQAGIDFQNQIASEMTGTKTSFRGDKVTSLPRDPNTKIRDVMHTMDYGTFKFNIIFKGHHTPGYWKGNSIQVGSVDQSSNIIKTVE